MALAEITGKGSVAVGTTTILAAGLTGWVYSLALTPGSAASTVELRVTSGSGAVKYSLGGGANTAGVAAAFPVPIRCEDGIFLVVAGTAATAAVAFSTTPP